ncbi:uncharacterized protein LOC135588870 [Musa acuminata AAA Group]|uniref:uncharacterized protein LOC135588870 n=1 Tax=Musa acuminata AAA Group TaxID=214697 RepID=UPI0031D0CC17
MSSSSLSSSLKTVETATSSNPASSSDEKAARALEALMWSHDHDSTVGESLLSLLRDRYGIPEEFVLRAPEPGQRVYDPIPRCFALTLDAFEAGLRLPFHPVITSCVSWWRISPSQMAPNSWRYLAAFLGECHYARITPTRDLFLSCFRLTKGLGGYYLSAQAGFRVSGAPSSNKGWKRRFFFVSRPGDWGFGVRWGARVIDNTIPVLDDEGRRGLQRLREILPASRAIRNMSERWLAEAGLSPVPLEMVRLEALRGVETPAAVSDRSPSVARVGTREAPVDVEVGQPRKKARVLPSDGPEVVTASAEGVMAPTAGAATAPVAEGVVAPADHAAGSQAEGEAGPSGRAAMEAPRQPSIRELLRLPLGREDEPYLAREVGALPRGAATEPLVGRWDGLTRGSRVWADSDCAARTPGFDLSPSPGQPLLIATLSSRNAELRKQADEARAGAGPEVVAAAASDLEAEAVRLRSELQASTERSAEFQMRLETSEGRNTELQTSLRASVAEARSARADSLELLRRLEESRAEARGASEALDAEIRQRPGRDKKLIEDYKDFPGFQLGLVRTGRVSYEYGYRVALAHFKVRNPGSEVMEDPFGSFLEDLDVGMPSDVPFDDSPDAPEG